MSGKPYSQKSGLKNHTNERISQVMTRLWPGNEHSYEWVNFPSLWPIPFAIVILPKLQEIQKLFDGRCRIAHGTAALFVLILFDGISAHISTLEGHKKNQEVESKRMIQPLRISLLLSLYCSFDWSQKSVFFSAKPVPDGIIEGHSISSDNDPIKQNLFL